MQLAAITVAVMVYYKKPLKTTESFNSVEYLEDATESMPYHPILSQCCSTHIDCGIFVVMKDTQE